MGVPKRKAPDGQDGAASPAGAGKRARTEELTGVRFKAQLRDPQGAGQGECGASPGRGARVCEAASRPGFGRRFRVLDTAPPFCSFSVAEGQSLVFLFAYRKRGSGDRASRGRSGTARHFLALGGQRHKRAPTCLVVTVPCNDTPPFPEQLPSADSKTSLLQLLSE